MTYRSIMHPCEACKLNHEYYLLHSYHLFQWGFIDYFLVHYQNVSEIQHIKVTEEVHSSTGLQYRNIPDYLHILCCCRNWVRSTCWCQLARLTQVVY